MAGFTVVLGRDGKLFSNYRDGFLLVLRLLIAARERWERVIVSEISLMLMLLITRRSGASGTGIFAEKVS